VLVADRIAELMRRQGAEFAAGLPVGRRIVSVADGRAALLEVVTGEEHEFADPEAS